MIIASAIKFTPHFGKYPVVIRGKRHADCLEEAYQMGYEWGKEELVQGFSQMMEDFLIDMMQRLRLANVVN